MKYAHRDIVFPDVFRGTWKGEAVVVKVFREAALLGELRKEVRVNALPHKNITALRGVSRNCIRTRSF